MNSFGWSTLVPCVLCSTECSTLPDFIRDELEQNFKINSVIKAFQSCLEKSEWKENLQAKFHRNCETFLFAVLSCCRGFSPTENKNVVFFCQRPPTRLLLNIRKSSHLFCYCTFCSCNCWLPCKALRCVDSWLFGCLTAWHSISLTGSCISVIHHLLQKEFRYEQPF